MSKKRDEDRRKGASEKDRAAACDELLEEAVSEDGYESELDDSDEDDDMEFNTPFLSPIQGKKVWIVLAGILVVVAVAVLYVYQAGDKKTILGNQPIPVGQLNVQNQNFGGIQNVPVGGGIQNFPNAQPSMTGGASSNQVQCPKCATKGLPVCSSCGTVMQPLSDGSGLFACPSCGSVGIPICPGDGAHMIARGNAGPRPAVGMGGNVGGQFQCPACGATGLPNWDPVGSPICPNCGTQMKVRSTVNPALAAAP